jgi:N-acetyl sugar amidotransferase
MTKTYQECTRCVMDTSASDITFDERGVCNYCSEFIERAHGVLHMEQAARGEELDRFVAQVQAAGIGKPYDCIIGVSGGVDSSWALVQALELGLRPLAVHMDNGWDSELAQNNIANLVRGLGVDLYTHVIDWDEYRNLMQAFFDADVIDVEMLYDNAMLAVNYQQAARHGVKYILAGTNLATEGMRIPSGWNWFKYDRRNIRAIGRQFGAVRLRTFPSIGILGFVMSAFVRRIKWVSFLDFCCYEKFEAQSVLQAKYGYKPYLYKHYESIFTRFYQGFILPEKFGVDKRRLHLGTLVASGQMSRDDALKNLKRIPYPSEQALEDDKQYFLKKMRWTATQLEDYLTRPSKPHDAYPSERRLWDFCGGIYKRYGLDHRVGNPITFRPSPWRAVVD